MKNNLSTVVALTPYKVHGHVIEDLHYSKIFYIDELLYSNQEEIDSAIEDMALDDWFDDSDWLEEEGDLLEGFEILKLGPLKQKSA